MLRSKDKAQMTQILPVVDDKSNYNIKAVVKG